MRSPEAITNGAIHLMQILEGMGEHYSPAEIDLAVNNVLCHYERSLLRELRSQVKALRPILAIGTDDALIDAEADGWDQAIDAILALLNGEVET